MQELVKQHTIGRILILASAASFGFMVVFGRWAYDDGLDASSLLFWRFSIAAVFLWIGVFIMRLPFPRGKPAGIALSMGVLYTGNASTYFVALALAPAGLVAMLFYLYPAMVATLAWFILKEQVSRTGILAMLLAMAGAIMTIGGTTVGVNAGFWLAIASAGFYSMYILGGRKWAGDLHPLIRSALVTTAAALVFTITVLVKGLIIPTSAGGWISVFGIALGSTVFGITAFLAGLHRISSTNAATLSATEPVVSALSGALLLAEPLTRNFTIGAAMIVVAAILIARSQSPVASVPPQT